MTTATDYVRWTRKAASERKAAMLDKRRAALGFVLDASAELLAAMRSAGLGTDRQTGAIRAVRARAGAALEAMADKADA